MFYVRTREKSNNLFWTIATNSAFRNNFAWRNNPDVEKAGRFVKSPERVRISKARNKRTIFFKKNASSLRYLYTYFLKHKNRRGNNNKYF